MIYHKYYNRIKNSATDRLFEENGWVKKREVVVTLLF